MIYRVKTDRKRLTDPWVWEASVSGWVIGSGEAALESIAYRSACDAIAATQSGVWEREAERLLSNVGEGE